MRAPVVVPSARRRLSALLALTGALAGPAGAQDPRLSPPESMERPELPELPELPLDTAADPPAGAAVELPPDTLAVELLSADSWRARLERDRALSFTLGSANDALAGVEGYTALQRAAAWVAVGQVGHLPSRPLLRERALSGVGVEREGALLGLASYGAGDEALFARLARGEDPSLAGCAVLALAVTGSSRGRDALAELAEDVPERTAEIGAAVVLVTDPLEALPTEAASRWLELRWEAARRWGFVGGSRWEHVLVDALCQSDEFLEDVILSEASRLSSPGVRDHLMQHLLDVGGRAAAEAVARSMQADLARTIRHGLWEPRDAEEWRVLFDEIELGKPHREVVELLRRAVDVPELSTRATLLWIGTGDPGAEERITELAESPEPRLRQGLARALGATGDSKWIPELSRMRLDSHPGVRSESIVAQVRLGHSPAGERLRTVLRDPRSNERPRVVELLAELAHSRPLQPFLVEALAGSEGVPLLTLATRLAAQGVQTHRDLLRDALASGSAGTLAPAMVRALATGAGSADLQLLRDLFPVEGSLAMNLELARGLLRVRDPEVLPVVRAALWRGPWHRSQLAAALFAGLRGVRGLLTELETPPDGADRNARRRVGFAIGELGGIGEVEGLARRRRSGDPALQGAYLGALTARTQ